MGTHNRCFLQGGNFRFKHVPAGKSVEMENVGARTTFFEPGARTYVIRVRVTSVKGPFIRCTYEATLDTRAI